MDCAVGCLPIDFSFQLYLQHLKKNMDLESTYFIPSMVAIGHMAQLCPGEFASPVRTIVTKFIVKELLMQDRVSISFVGSFIAVCTVLKFITVNHKRGLGYLSKS